MNVLLKYFIIAFSIASPSVQAEAWINLLDSDNLNQWENGSKHNRLKVKEVGEQWSIKDGVLSLDKSKEGRGGHIVTKKDDYFNFELKFEFKISKEGNSGIKYRVTPETVGLEYQILDDSKPQGAKNSLASLYNLKAAKNTKKVNEVGVEWNTGRIIAYGNHLQHWLNGEKVVEIEFGSNEWKKTFGESKYKDDLGFARSPGPIHIQDHQHEVDFRNVCIRELTTFEIYKVDLVATKNINNKLEEFKNEETGEFDVQIVEKLIHSGRVFRRKCNFLGDEELEDFVVTTKIQPEIDAHDIEAISPDKTTRTRVLVNLTLEGGKKNEKFTSTDMTSGIDQIAIVVDGVCISCPIQQADSLGREFIVSGMRNFDETFSLSTSIMNSLKCISE